MRRPAIIMVILTMGAFITSSAAYSQDGKQSQLSEIAEDAIQAVVGRGPLATLLEVKDALNLVRGAVDDSANGRPVAARGLMAVSGYVCGSIVLVGGSPAVGAACAPTPVALATCPITAGAVGYFASEARRNCSAVMQDALFQLNTENPGAGSVLGYGRRRWGIAEMKISGMPDGVAGVDFDNGCVVEADNDVGAELEAVISDAERSELQQTMQCERSRVSIDKSRKIGFLEVKCQFIAKGTRQRGSMITSMRFVHDNGKAITANKFIGGAPFLTMIYRVCES